MQHLATSTSDHNSNDSGFGPPHRNAARADNAILIAMIALWEGMSETERDAWVQAVTPGAVWDAIARVV